jgi:hypothetical protein
MPGIQITAHRSFEWWLRDAQPESVREDFFADGCHIARTGEQA